ncbi:hypothetical protein CVT26_009559 [Gymnopilus dilepis]|uniref:Uncharacterized protein n=1 Tax=Gymnopilus dilepis TaxID=231916 RepID=A0A409VKG1_9AGAR|nr:hypothetical protein CVT26_009559 [Gymnopilus dilepis]
MGSERCILNVQLDTSPEHGSDKKHQLKGRLASSRKDLEETRTEIARLECNLAHLRAKEEALQDSISCCVSLLSPIHELPPDVLRDIFYRCLPDHRNPLIAASEAPMLLTRICSLWRSIAYTSPSLWSRIHITYSNDYLPRIDAGYQGSIELYARKLRLRCNVVSDWLARAGACPLSISLHYTSSPYRYASAADADDDLSVRLFQTILKFAPQWTELELIIPHHCYTQLLLMMPPAETFSMLRTLRTNLGKTWGVGGIHHLAGPATVPEFPNLEKLTLATEYDIWPCPLDNRSVHWSRITYLCMHPPFDILTLSQILKNARFLVHCKAHISDHNHPEDLQLDGNVVLPQLKSLSVFEKTLPGTATVFYDSLHIPGLTWIEYRRQNPPEVWTPSEDDKPCPLSFLLRKATQLKKLTLDVRSEMTGDQILEAFKLASNITHLVLGEELGAPEKSIEVEKDAWYWPNFDIGPLIVNEECAADEILLPDLRVIQMRAPPGLSDEDWQRCIISRLDPSGLRGVAALKQARVVFGRGPQLLDMNEKILHFAKTMGVAFESEVQNITFWEPITDATSASYGLDGGDMTWSKRDIDERVRLLIGLRVHRDGLI